MLQADLVKDVINTNDATIIGILIAVIIILIGAILKLWNKIGKQEDYIKEQDKENLKMIYTVTGTVNSFGDDLKGINSTTSDNNVKISQLLTVVLERLKNMNHGNH
ncbi:hypothetical protein [uncultured Christiangramia sp.]|uniref:hypothetical protein n=1 Tax=uncultured Christiangramia sp. TaxID=503836 RepID=UPI00261E1C27|nr:hypothetical protein [uncultured Christiangramia sp.]